MDTSSSENNSGIGKVITISLFILALAGVFVAAIYFGQKYFKESEQKAQVDTEVEFKQSLPEPVLNSTPLLDAHAGKEYKENVFVSLIGINEAITVVVTDLPPGLVQGECTSRFDTNLVPQKPNTLTICTITGVPTTVGYYKVKVYSEISGQYKNSENFTYINVVNN